MCFRLVNLFYYYEKKRTKTNPPMWACQHSTFCYHGFLKMYTTKSENLSATRSSSSFFFLWNNLSVWSRSTFHTYPSNDSFPPDLPPPHTASVHISSTNISIPPFWLLCLHGRVIRHPPYQFSSRVTFLLPNRPYHSYRPYPCHPYHYLDSIVPYAIT